MKSDDAGRSRNQGQGIVWRGRQRQIRAVGRDAVFTVGHWISATGQKKWVIEGIDDQSWEGAFASAAMRKVNK